jgi:hypothetical protein
MYKTINIDIELHKELKIEAIRKGISLTELISEKLGQKKISEKPDYLIKQKTEQVLENVALDKKGSFVKQRGEINSDDYIGG